MAPVMILNPRARRPRRSGGRRKPPMTAKQLRYFGPRRSKRVKRRKAQKVIIATTNPKRRGTVAKRRRRHTRKASGAVRSRTYRRNPIKRRARRRTFRRNPISFHGSMGGFFDNAILPAAYGAAGAIAADMLIGNVAPMLPANLTQGPMLPLLRVGAALLLGYVAGEVAGDKVGEQVMAGGVTVALYATAKTWLATNAPAVTMARYLPMGYIGPARTMGMVRRRRRRLAGIRQRRAMLVKSGSFMPQGNGMNGVPPTRLRIMRGASGQMGRYGK